MNQIHSTFDSPAGELLLVGDGRALSGLWFLQGRRQAVAATLPGRRDDDAFALARRQLDQYFAGERRSFEVPLAPRGTEWELRVWAALRAIPYGETRSYGQIAAAVGTVAAARAVGLANARNPISVIVPCHRVIGADGSLTGYGGGLRAQALPARPRGGPTRPARRGRCGQLSAFEGGVEEALRERLGDPADRHEAGDREIGARLHRQPRLLALAQAQVTDSCSLSRESWGIRDSATEDGRCVLTATFDGSRAPGSRARHAGPYVP